MTEQPKFVTTTKAAVLCNVSRFTIMNWVDAGKLKSAKTAGGHRRVLMQDLIRFMRENQLGEIGKTSDADLSIPMCWEFKEFKVSPDHDCGKCLVFKEKANKCFLLVREFGAAKVQCRHDCVTCEYLKKYYPKKRQIILGLSDARALRKGALQAGRQPAAVEVSAERGARAGRGDSSTGIVRGIYESGKYLANIRRAFAGKSKQSK
ncbi:MAG: helix-turn-helix domain-containing protein [Candidatus Omnitrophica bacterium]|nr:helix-turn-helix domain-containing protein [Candidatus Omnitrophota bacterium]